MARDSILVPCWNYMIASNTESAIENQFNENFETNKQRKEEKSEAEFEKKSVKPLVVRNKTRKQM